MIIAQDLYPEVVIAHGMLRSDSFAARQLKRLFGWAYKRAAGVAALGPVMAERLVEKGVRPERVSVISNWATGPEEVVRGSENVLRKEWELDGKFVLLYSGNLGVAHDIETTIRALSRVIKVRPEVRLVIVGKGTRIDEAKALVQEHGMAEFVLFKPLVPAHLLPHSLGLADVALVTLGESFSGLVVPSKLLGYMARRIPTVYVGPPSDVSTMLAQSGGGVSFRNADVQGLAEVLGGLVADRGALARMGSSAAHYYAEHFARPVALRRYADLIGSLSRQGRPMAQDFVRP
jgi:glycosyltransferase involved in cell wall biosynthesis